MTVCVGSVDDLLAEALVPEHIDFLFIDHEKARYLEDLKKLEGRLGSGAIVVADNVLSFGVPMTEYMEYVRGEKWEGSETFACEIEYCGEGEKWEDGVEVSVWKGG